MRKILLFITIILAVVVFINRHQDDEEIRVRIIPNSNSEEDLAIKDKVKEVTMYYLEELYEKNYQKYFNNINNSYNLLEDFIDDNIINVNIEFKRHTLYNKTYNDNVVENENYYTLYIEIEEANGNNWWSSIYPEFLYDGSTDTVIYKSLILEFINEIKEK